MDLVSVFNKFNIFLVIFTKTRLFVLFIFGEKKKKSFVDAP